jgi:hypothetical protein
MPLTLNIDPPHVTNLKRHAKKLGLSASRLVTEFIDGLTTETPPPSLGRTIKTLRQHRHELANKGLLNIAVIGSVARGEERPGSDTDLLVKVSDDMSAFRLAGLQSELRELLGAKVDVVTLEEFKGSFDRTVQEDVIVAY